MHPQEHVHKHTHVNKHANIGANTVSGYTFPLCLSSLSSSLLARSFSCGHGTRAPRRSHVGTLQLSAMGDTVMIDSNMTVATSQTLLAQVLYCTFETDKLTSCALTQRSQDTRRCPLVSTNRLLLGPPFDAIRRLRRHRPSPLVATIRRHSSPPFAATIRRHTSAVEALRDNHSSPLDAIRSHHHSTSSPGALGLPWHCDFNTVTLRSIFSRISRAAAIAHGSEQMVASLSTVARIL